MLEWVIRFLHITAGVAWVGGAVIWSMVIAPRLMQRGPPAIRRPVLEALIEALPRYFYTTGGATIVLGVTFLGVKYGWGNVLAVFQGTYAGTSYGYALGAGLLLAVGMLAIGYFVITPTSHQMLDMMKSMPTPAPGTPPSPPPADVQAKMGALGKKMGMASMLNVLLGVLAVAAMTWAVNQVR